MGILNITLPKQTQERIWWAWLEKIISDKAFTDAEFERLIRLLQATGGIAYCREIARDHIRRAKDIIRSFPVSDTAQTLLMIAEYTLTRNT